MDIYKKTKPKWWWSSQDELGGQRAGVRWWKVLHGMCEGAAWMVPLVGKVHLINICMIYCRVWGGEETINEYKARIRIFSVRHQDTLGVQERFERQKSKIPKKFHLVGSGLGAGRLFHSVWAGSVVFNSWHFGLFCLGHLYCNAFSTFDFSGIVSFETWPLLTLYPWMLLIKSIKFIKFI